MMVIYTEHLPVHQNPIIVLTGEKALPTATFIHERRYALFTTCSGDQCMLQAGNKSRNQSFLVHFQAHTGTGGLCVAHWVHAIYSQDASTSESLNFVQAVVVWPELQHTPVSSYSQKLKELIWTSE